jgi:hypothetical protein
MNRLMGGWVDGWRMDGWMGGWVDGGWMDGWMGGWMDGWIDGWVDGRWYGIILRIELADRHKQSIIDIWRDVKLVCFLDVLRY